MLHHLRALSRGLEARGVHSAFAGPADLLCELAGTRRGDPAGADGVVSISDRPSVTGDMRAAVALSRLLRRHPASLVHAHGYRAGWVASLADRGGRPLVATFHNLCPEHAGRLARAALRRMVREANGLIGISQATVESVRAAAWKRGSRPSGPRPLPCHVEIIPNGIDAPPEVPCRADARRALGLDPECFILLAVGRFIRDKGLDVAIESMACWSAPEGLLLVVGDGPDRPFLETRIRDLRLEGRVRLLGWRDDVSRLLAAADVVLVPSRREGQSLVALEAMALARAVVASAVGGLVETVRDGETGYLVPPENGHGLAEATARIYRQPDLGARLGAAAREFVLRERTVDGMVESTARLYRELLREPHRGRRGGDDA